MMRTSGLFHLALRFDKIIPILGCLVLTRKNESKVAEMGLEQLIEEELDE